MIKNIKNYFIFCYVDKCIREHNYDLALEKLNYLINEGFMPNDTFLKRGKLCHKLLMLDDANADFTYIITNCSKKYEAYYERMKLSYEQGHYFETISDANKLLEQSPNCFEYKKYKFMAFICTGQIELAKEYIYHVFDFNKYQTIQFLFKETAYCVSADELAKGLKILDIVEMIDPDNPLKIFNEATIYQIANNPEKHNELMKRLASVFPKYFISHFRFTDMYTDRDMLETSFLLELKIFDTQNNFAYPMSILKGYKKYMEGHITESKEAFENAVKINPNKPEGYVLLAQTLQLMSGYDNPEYKKDAEINYRKAMEIYKMENLTDKSEDMKRQIKHLNSNLSFH